MQVVNRQQFVCQNGGWKRRRVLLLGKSVLESARTKHGLSWRGLGVLDTASVAHEKDVRTGFVIHDGGTPARRVLRLNVLLQLLDRLDVQCGVGLALRVAGRLVRRTLLH